MPKRFNASTELTELEKRREENIRRNEEMMIKLGLLAPNATLKSQSRKRARQQAEFSDTDTSDDEEWTPQGEWSKSMKKQPMTSYDEVERYKARVVRETARKEAAAFKEVGKPSSEQREKKGNDRERPDTAEACAPNLTCPLLVPPKPEEIVAAESTGGQRQTKRYPRRQASSKVTYREDQSDDDDYIYCEDCDDWSRGDCANCGPLQPLNSELLGSKPGRSVHTTLLIPPEVRIRKSIIIEAGLGAFSKSFIPKGTRIGPYTGEVIHELNLNPERDTSYMWEVTCSNSGKKLIDGKSEKFANWMRFVNCARDEDEQNLVAYQYKGEIYYRTFRDIPPHVELLVWYGKEYALELGISTEDAALLHTTEATPAEEDGPALPSGIVRSKNSKPNFTVQLGRKGGVRTHNSIPGLIRVSRSFSTTPKLSSQVSILDNVTARNGSAGGDSQSAPIMGQEHTGHPARVPTKRLWVQAEVSMRKVFKCKACGELNESREEHVEHVRIHLSLYPQQCQQCGEIFRWKSKLVTHMLVHTGEKPYKCKVCGAAFSQKNTLVKHTRIHTGEKPYKCKVCGAAFSQKNALVNHTRIHTGEKPYKCKVCGAAFSESSNLVNHTRIHTGEKPYKCKVCGAAFSQKNALVDHTRIHTGEKPYKCKVCGDAFSRRDHLTVHATTHTARENRYE